MTSLPLSQALGAEIRGIDAAATLSADDAARLRDAWLQHLVLVLRAQRLDEAAQVRFAAYFGVPAGAQRPCDPSSRLQIDQCYRERPPSATLLYQVEGERSARFANGYLAYAALPAPLRLAVGDRSAMHICTRAPTFREAGNEELACAHPVVRTHPQTGRKSLYVNPAMTHHIEGVDIDESYALLQRLFQALERPEVGCELVLRPGDLVLWDNRCVLYALGNPASAGRWVRLTGERPN